MNALDHLVVPKLFSSIERNDILESMIHIEKLSDVNTKWMNMSILMQAALWGSIEVTSRLLTLGVNVDYNSHKAGTALHCAILRGHTNVALLLIKSGANPKATLETTGLTPTHLSCIKGNSLVLKTLLEHGAEVDMKMLGGMAPVHYTPWSNNTRILDLLMRYGADIFLLDENGKSALNYAEELSNKSMYARILEYMGCK